jgi:hypothetical protein
MSLFNGLLRFGGGIPAILGVTVLSFGAGSLMSTQILRAEEAKAKTDRVYELMVYHTYPGKAPDLETIFRNSHALQAKYLNVLGYWMPTEDSPWKDTFVYLVVHPSREAAERHWHALHSNPQFPQYREAAIPLIQRTGDDFEVDEIYMRPSDFSALK